MKKDDVKQLARQTLIDHGLYSVPVNPVVVASKLGVRLQNAVFRDPKYSGLTARRAGGVTILIKQDDAPVRKRFSVAHEIGHYLLHLKDGTDEIIDTDADLFRVQYEPQSGSWSEHRQREFEANVFAAELLMPSELVTQVWNAIPEDERTVAVMAKVFQVSEEAMGIRLGELGVLG